MDTLQTATSRSDKPKFSFYENFDGRYHKVGEIRDLIPQFKAFYYAEKRKDPAQSAIKIINAFNGQIAPLTFFPWEKQYKLWRKKWDAELLSEQGYLEERTKTREFLGQRGIQEFVTAPDQQFLDSGARTLAGELLNDAMSILKKDQENEGAYKDEIVVKRRAYILNVFNYVTKSVHGAESLRIKTNSDQRETVGFLMDLMNSATAGKLTERDLTVLKSTDVIT